MPKGKRFFLSATRPMLFFTSSTDPEFRSETSVSTVFRLMLSAKILLLF